MAIHFHSIRPSEHATSGAAARLAPRTSASTVQRPESAAAFRRLATAVSAPAGAASATAQTAQAAIQDGEAAIRALFPDMGGSNAPVASTPASAAPPTAESVFGPNPWLSNPTGMAPDGSIYGYNPMYFATPQTAAKVAQMLGGTVVQANEITNAPGSTFQQQQPNQMVLLKNGALINPGLVAGFYTHGYPQSMVDQMIANEVANTAA